MSKPAELPEHDRSHLDELLAGCPPLTVLAEHVRAFAELLTTRCGTDLEDWMNRGRGQRPARAARLRPRLRKDLDAVVAGLSLPYSNGPIEGTNTKFKLLKRRVQALEAADVWTRRLRPAAPAGHAQWTRRHHLFCARA
jgi:transposase